MEAFVHLCAFAHIPLEISMPTCGCIGVYSDIVLHIHCALAASGVDGLVFFPFAISQAKQHHHENSNGGFRTKTRCKLVNYVNHSRKLLVVLESSFNG